MTYMTKISVMALVLCAAPALAEDEASGKSLMQQGAEMFLKGLTEQMEPALDDLKSLTEEMGPQMRDFFTEMGPALGTILEDVKDWSVYEAPEILPNGDIIIRRKPDAPKGDEEAPTGPVDL